MDAWRGLGALAEFPGTLVLEDARPATEAYPSEGVTPEGLQQLEPALLQQAAAQGARLYRQEGAQAECILISENLCNLKCSASFQLF